MGDIKVENIWVDENGKQEGARLSFDGQLGRPVDMSVQELQAYKSQIKNADVTDDGLKAKDGFEIPQLKLERKTGRPVESYTLMHADSEVCRIYTAENDSAFNRAGGFHFSPLYAQSSTVMKVDLINGALLPFYLTGANLTALRFFEWLNYRVDNLSRTYMNRVYMIRKVGRDRESILRDSCAISIIDNYWVRRSDIDTSWQELKRKRDSNMALVNTALTGNISPEQFKQAVDDTTSLYTIKGAFPKAILHDFILKKDNNAEYEFIAYQLGSALGISVAEAVKQDDGVVACSIFTSEDVSMVHARDLLHLTDYDTTRGDDWHRATYEYFEEQGRDDIVRQLERLYILNYLFENMDFHYENFGFLYDSNSFEIIRVAPAYDFNSAFGGWDDVLVSYSWILDRLPTFIYNHADIKERLQGEEFANVLDGTPDLSVKQKHSIMNRAKYLRGLRL